MPLLDRQKRAAEIGIIRIGTSRPRGEGKPGRTPVKLDRLRFTSRSEMSIRAIAAEYGGEARQWVDGAPTPGQWEVITQAREIPVSVPPGELVIDAWYELWTKGVRERKCDGVQDQLNGMPCVCDPERRACKPHTRLRVILPDIPGGGTWRLNTSGENAADELAGVTETLALYSARGHVLPAVLRLEQRQTNTAQGVRQYVVPVLQLTNTVRELMSMPSGGVVSLPPPPASVLALEAAKATGHVEGESGPVWPPESPEDLALLVEQCTDQRDLRGRLATCANGREWMDEHVPSRYSPDDSWIELREVFRARDAELSEGNRG